MNAHCVLVLNIVGYKVEADTVPTRVAPVQGGTPTINHPRAGWSGYVEISVRFRELSEWGANNLWVVPEEASVCLCSISGALSSNFSPASLLFAWI